ncbi:hypothetical protein GNY06_13135 [Elizabethkingia argentiflava]|uniref:HmuY protein n=1 Tax=Elizabethkingia argenteiflava TaxID=2681556 RepID=A0A845Q1S6_9FLAO|nr:HmuY family protein [Elizabethkingia argenteiflava]NAW52280.1 hypothetical protein [Elizabethkingia argenteiflava]
MKTIFITTATAIMLFCLASCSSDDRDSGLVTEKGQASTSIKVQEVKDVNATDQAKFTLYSLRENKVIKAEDKNTDKWDIGFSTTKIIINGGKIRKGKGAATIVKGSFEDIKSAPDDKTFKVDNAENDLAITTGSGNGWYTYNMTKHTIHPIPGNIIVIKTGDGKYAKIQIMSYYKGAPANIPDESKDSGYYTFKFALQTNGSNIFSK